MNHRQELRVLIVEDNATTGQAVSRMLAQAGYRCEHVAGGNAAYRAYCGGRHDLVITDLKMEGGDGFTLIDRVREVSEVPVLVITGTNAGAAREQLRDFPRVTVLGKPFQKEGLLSAAEALIDASQHEGTPASASAA